MHNIVRLPVVTYCVEVTRCPQITQSIHTTQTMLNKILRHKGRPQLLKIKLVVVNSNYALYLITSYPICAQFKYWLVVFTF